MEKPRQIFEIEVHVRIKQVEPPGFSYGQLGVNETVTVEANGFMELCTVLAKFHDLAEQIKKEKK